MNRGCGRKCLTTCSSPASMIALVLSCGALGGAASTVGLLHDILSEDDDACAMDGAGDGVRSGHGGGQSGCALELLQASQGSQVKQRRLEQGSRSPRATAVSATGVVAKFSVEAVRSVAKASSEEGDLLSPMYPPMVAVAACMLAVSVALLAAACATNASNLAKLAEMNNQVALAKLAEKACADGMEEDSANGREVHTASVHADIGGDVAVLNVGGDLSAAVPLLQQQAQNMIPATPRSVSDAAELSQCEKVASFACQSLSMSFRMEEADAEPESEADVEEADAFRSRGFAEATAMETNAAMAAAKIAALVASSAHWTPTSAGEAWRHDSTMLNELPTVLPQSTA